MLLKSRSGLSPLYLMSLSLPSHRFTSCTSARLLTTLPLTPRARPLTMLPNVPQPGLPPLSLLCLSPASQRFTSSTSAPGLTALYLMALHLPHSLCSLIDIQRGNIWGGGGETARGRHITAERNMRMGSYFIHTTLIKTLRGRPKTTYLQVMKS